MTNNFIFSYDWKNNTLCNITNLNAQEQSIFPIKEEFNEDNEEKLSIYIKPEVIKDTSYLLDYKYIFTVDWFSNNIPIWNEFLKDYKNKQNLNFLEIGSFQGRSTVWLLENILTDPSSKITCIDTFEGSAEHIDNFKDDIKNLFDIFKHNIFKFKNKVNIIKDKSQQALKQINEQYDFIYIDGDHKASSVLEDAIFSFPLIKPGGIIIFDDYLWFGMKLLIDNPKPAIDAFLEIYGDKINILYKGYQVIIQKK